MESLMRCEFVKIKKLLALALSAVMAVSMLTACAGATTVTTANGTLYWIIGFEFETKATA